ncbi:T9SS type A sorting domain-containing protein [Prevotella disiens]|jgi:hypothetical protein|uniref:T9SS C-terminal target domain-containing protein n=3 Tax=Prevotella disiens TaxID=28130 RepID=A0A379DYR6_9BACT|nr:T9SS type A sorting domain-containing protein [Prevotella disiens]ERJ80141.1 hypothetical protein HMPREF0653_00490 [Prevotella disiens JCM 6334 = ATCC 29426]KGF47112.1 secretion protein [Prevotella disiens DNF00882]RGK99481.1 T9SS C-terminal target domain-containing protein [Prevotella disiens]SUB85565.1 Uncharacterised protein [Prevotella disiens]
MNKKIYTLLLAFILLGAALPNMVQAATTIEMQEQEINTISISISGNVLRVEGADNETLYIYNVVGVRVMSIKIDGQDKRYSLSLPKGCYIIKVGKVVRKISIR